MNTASKGKTKRGRKTLLTATLQRGICKLLEAGNTVKTASAAVGISERTFHNWCERNPAFLAAIARARAKAKIKLVAIITDAAKIEARHAEWLLERGWPNEYGRPYRELAPQEAENPIGVTVVCHTGGKTIEQLLDFPVVKQPQPAQPDIDDDSGIDAGDNGAEESFGSLRRRGLL
jgi:hypothetical protein